MLAPKCSTYNGRPTFANPRYLKKAQSEKPCLYEIPYDTSDLANRFGPNREETMTLANESRSKLNKDYINHFSLEETTNKLTDALKNTSEAIQADCTHQSYTHHLQQLPPEIYAHLEYAPTTYQQQQPEFSQPDSSLVVPVFQKGDDPIDAINHMMSFLTAVVTRSLEVLLTNNQLRTSSNPRNKLPSMNWKSETVKSDSGRQTTMLLDNKKFTILVQVVATTAKHRTLKASDILTHNAAYQADDQDAIDSACDGELNSAKLLSWPISQEMAQNALTESETDIISDSNIIPYSQYLSETQQETVQNINSHCSTRCPDIV
ncbi:hypothetical protein Tco_1103902 [Tanacetum coccineum]